MSLDKHEAVPVDTHVWQITAKHYMTNQLKTKSLTAKVYKEIGTAGFLVVRWGALLSQGPIFAYVQGCKWLHVYTKFW